MASPWKHHRGCGRLIRTGSLGQGQDLGTRWGWGVLACHSCLQRSLHGQHKTSPVDPWQSEGYTKVRKGMLRFAPKLPEQLLPPCSHFFSIQAQRREAPLLLPGLRDATLTLRAMLMC